MHTTYLPLVQYLICIAHLGTPLNRENPIVASHPILELLELLSVESVDSTWESVKIVLYLLRSLAIWIQNQRLEGVRTSNLIYKSSTCCHVRS